MKRINIDKVVLKINRLSGNFKPDIAMILGSGLSDACPDIKVIKEINYKEVGLPESIVKGHNDKFIFGEYKGLKIVKLSRFHYYESGDLKTISLPFEILKKLGVRSLISATATGGINKSLKAGDIVLVKDHINLAPNPLIARRDQFFLDMSDAYDKVYRNIEIGRAHL
jgi:purine-nucleoside phosphorylase